MAGIDEQIDETARGLTIGEPDAGFNARVLARITSSNRRGVLGLTWVLTTGGVAGAAIMAGILLNGPERAPERASSVVPDAQQADNIIAVPRNQDDAARPVTRAARERRNAGVRRDGYGEQIVVSAPPPIDVPPLVVEAISAESQIPIARLAVEPLDVTPLSSE